MTRAAFAALSHPEAAVAGRLSPEPMPGLIRAWKIRPADDTAWKDLTLPQAGAATSWWFDQERGRGFSVKLDRDVGPAKRIEATATRDAPAARDIFLNTGAERRPGLEERRLDGLARRERTASRTPQHWLQRDPHGGGQLVLPECHRQQQLLAPVHSGTSHRVTAGGRTIGERDGTSGDRK